MEMRDLKLPACFSCHPEPGGCRARGLTDGVCLTLKTERISARTLDAMRKRLGNCEVLALAPPPKRFVAQEATRLPMKPSLAAFHRRSVHQCEDALFLFAVPERAKSANFVETPHAIERVKKLRIACSEFSRFEIAAAQILRLKCAGILRSEKMK